jgi:predicted ATPase
MADLPEPQRRALEVALLRSEPEGEPSQRAVALATLGVLRAIAGERPTVVGVDDVQWLDPESESALAFLVRRLRNDRVGLLMTRRSEGSTSLRNGDPAFARCRA